MAVESLSGKFASQDNGIRSAKFFWLLAALIGAVWTFSRCAEAGPLLFPDFPEAVRVLLLVAVTSVISGSFGMAGGMILIGGLILFLDLTSAMLLATVVLVSTNLWRMATWLGDVKWGIVGLNLLGGLMAFAALQLAGYRPTRAVMLLVIGAPPLLMNFLPRDNWPSIDTRRGQLLCGFVVGLSQIMGAASAALSDMFYQRTVLTRTQIVALRAACVVPFQILRGAFFAMIAWQTTGTIATSVPAWLYIAAVIVALAGTTLGGILLKRCFTDGDFRFWSWRISMAVSVFFMGQGIWLLSR